MTIRKAIRAITTFFLIALFMYLGIILEGTYSLLRLSHRQRQNYRAQVLSFYCRILLISLGFRIVADGQENLKKLSGNALFVANHLSFWDAIFLSSLVSPIFVTSVEVKDTPFLGWLARLAGSIFVERRSRTQIEDQVSSLVNELSSGTRVVLFPEGTSTNGERVLPFKRALFDSALISNKPILPICINYRSIDGSPISSKNRDLVFYYGEQDFASQLLNIFTLSEIRVDISFLEPIIPNPDLSRQKLSDLAYEAITSQYIKIRAELASYPAETVNNSDLASLVT